METYAVNYSSNTRVMNGYNVTNQYRNVSASISDYPYDAAYGSNQQGGQIAAYYAPMPVQVGMDGVQGIPMSGGIIAVPPPMMGAEHERLLVLAKGNEQHKQVSDMLLKAAQSEATTSRKRCEELTLQLAEAEKQLEELKLENEVYKTAADDAKAALELILKEGSAEAVKGESGTLSNSVEHERSLARDREGDSTADTHSGRAGGEVGLGRHSTDQAATSLVKSVLLSPQHVAAAAVVGAAVAATKSVGQAGLRAWADDEDDEEDNKAPSDLRGNRPMRGPAHPRSNSGSYNTEGPNKGVGMGRDRDRDGGPNQSGSYSYSTHDKGRDRDLYDASRGGSNRMTHGVMRGNSAGGGGNVARPTRPTRIIPPQGTGTPSRPEDSLGIDRTHGQEQGSGPGQSMDARGDVEGSNRGGGDSRKNSDPPPYSNPKKCEWHIRIIQQIAFA